MKNKLILASLVTIFCFLLSFPETGSAEDSYEQEADNVAGKVMGRPRPDLMPDPAGMADKASRATSRSIGITAPGGASRSMGRTPGSGPGGPVMRPGAMLKSQGTSSKGLLPDIGPTDPIQQGVKGAGSVNFDGVEGEGQDPSPKKAGVKYDGVDGESKGAGLGQKPRTSMPVDPYDSRKMPIDPYGARKMPIDPYGAGKMPIDPLGHQ